MPRGREKSGRFRKVSVKTPGGRTVVHYRERNAAKAICAVCRKVLLGVPRTTTTGLSRVAKTAKRPERPYGGVLCSACTRTYFRNRARGEAQ